MTEIQTGPQRYFILPTDIEPGDQLRDHGRLRTVIATEYERTPFANISVRFTDGEPSLSIPPHEHVTVWRTHDEQEQQGTDSAAAR